MPRSRSARCWCAFGALYVEGVGEDGRAAHLLRIAAQERHGRLTLVMEVNDEFGHEAVLAMYDHAIALAAAEAEGR